MVCGIGVRCGFLAKELNLFFHSHFIRIATEGTHLKDRQNCYIARVNTKCDWLICGHVTAIPPGNK